MKVVTFKPLTWPVLPLSFAWSMASVTFKTLFTDKPMHASLGTILRWCDVSQAACYSAIGDTKVRRELLEQRSYSPLVLYRDIYMYI